MGGLVKGVSSLFGTATADRNLDDIQNKQRELAGTNMGLYQGQTANQTQFANQLAQGAMGTGGIASAQLQAAMDKNLQQQIAATKANRAVNPALAARQSAQMAAQGQRQVAADSANVKLAEQQQYMGYLNQLQGGVNGALNSAAGVNQQMGQQSQNQMGTLLSTAGQLGAAYMTGGASLAAPAVTGNATPGVTGGSGYSLGGGGDLMADFGFKNKGGIVEGKAKVAGDSIKNDTEPHMLSPGEVVVPRTIVKAGPEVAGKFVAQAAKEGKNFDGRAFLEALAAEMKSKGGKKEDTKAKSYAAVLSARKGKKD